MNFKFLSEVGKRWRVFSSIEYANFAEYLLFALRSSSPRPVLFMAFEFPSKSAQEKERRAGPERSGWRSDFEHYTEAVPLALWRAENRKRERGEAARKQLFEATDGVPPRKYRDRRSPGICVLLAFELNWFASFPTLSCCCRRNRHAVSGWSNMVEHFPYLPSRFRGMF